MSDLRLALDQWEQINHAEREQVAREIVRLAPAVTFDGIRGFAAFYRVASMEFVLMPGGDVELGFDVDGYMPEDDVAAAYQRAQGSKLVSGDLKAFLRDQLTPRRQARIECFLVQADPAEFPELDDDAEEDSLLTWLERRFELPEMRLPTSDEWEYAYLKKAMGLTIGKHRERWPEVTRDLVFRGGDGHAFSCGGFPKFFSDLVTWPAWREQTDEDGLFECVSERLYRRVLPISGV